MTDLELQRQRSRVGWLSAAGIAAILLGIVGWWLGETYWISTRHITPSEAAEVVPELGRLVEHDDWPKVAFERADVVHMRGHLHFPHLFAIRLYGVSVEPEQVDAPHYGRGIHDGWERYFVDDDEWPTWILSLNQETDGTRPNYGTLGDTGSTSAWWYLRERKRTFVLWIGRDLLPDDQPIQPPTALQSVLESVGYERTSTLVGSEYREWSRATVRVRD